MSVTPIRGFFAYPSKADISEVVRNAVGKINGTGIINIKTWESCRVGGKIVITEICKEIEQAHIFCADLTYLNHNVMFELGFAIARDRRIWLVLDPSVVETKADLAKLKMLTTVGHSPYSNSDDLSTKFLQEQPWSDLEATVFAQTIRPQVPRGDDTAFYLKSKHITEASTLISKEMNKASVAMGLPLIIDDPRETAVQPLAWYAEQILAARAVIAHLINPAREGAHLHNAKYSFVAGLAFGLDKPILMLAHGDFAVPLDYRELLKNYQTGSEAERHLHTWLVPIMERRKKETEGQQLYLASVKLAQQLAQLKIGEPIAENEAERLVNEYFIETTAYREALDGQQGIFVGRKGTGKSANFLKLTAALQSDKRNLVCVIKPLAYEMQGIVELLQQYKSVNLKGYAIEAIWKFLIYSEIALTAERAINSRPSGQVQVCEKNLIALLDQNAEMLRQDFSIRLERCVAALLDKSKSIGGAPIEKHRIAISETLHAGLLRRLREVLVEALAGKLRIAILVDNLDKAWDKQTDIENLAEFLLGLLGATNRIELDFRNVGLEHRSINVSLAVFVRADIFYRVISLAREPDKIVYSKLNWNDEELLLRVVEERFATSLGILPSEVWTKYFCPTTAGVPTKQYFTMRILKRPRDIVFFVKTAITMAVNRRHAMVEEKDVLDAEKQYSQFAIDSILVENGITVAQLENIIYEFAGSPAIITESSIIEVLSRVGIGQTKAGEIIQHLCNLTFLGVEVKADEFRFAEDQTESHKNTVLAQRLLSVRAKPPKYKLNPAFWSFLEVSG